MSIHKVGHGYVVVPMDVDDKLAELLEIRTEPGWQGHFSRKQYPGALANGTRIKKIEGSPGDKHSLGATGTILGSVMLYPWEPFTYFIEWDDAPRVAVAVTNFKVAPL